MCAHRAPIFHPAFQVFSQVTSSDGTLQAKPPDPYRGRPAIWHRGGPDGERGSPATLRDDSAS
ncbi:protein of unknown function [Streptomyces murinus]